MSRYRSARRPPAWRRAGPCTGSTASRSRSRHRSPATRRRLRPCSRGCSTRSGDDRDPDHRREGPRSRQRRRRRGPRRVPGGRQGGRRRRSRRPPDRRPRDGGDAGRRRHPRPHRGPEGHRGAEAVPDDRRDDPLDRTDVLRSGTGGLVPSTFATGYRYSLLGYTTVVEAAAPPLAARHVLSELRDTPMIDKAFLILMGNNQVLFELIRESGGGVSAALKDAVAWWLEATGGYGVKLVNPGGVELYKQSGGHIDSLDDEVAGFGVTPRQVLEAIGGAVDELGLPHPVHVHANNLGVPGNADTTLDTMRTLSGRQAHFAHVQFHSYGGKPGGLPRSRAPDLLEHLEQPSRVHRRRRPGDVRAGDDDDRRRARVRGAPRPRRRQVAQPRHRGRDRLRDRAVHLPGRQLRPCPAVGDRARAVPAGQGSLAGDAVDRPSERRLVPLLSRS